MSRRVHLCSFLLIVSVILSAGLGSPATGAVRSADQSGSGPHPSTTSLSRLAAELLDSTERLSALQRRVRGIGGVSGVTLLTVDRAYADLADGTERTPLQRRLSEALQGLATRLSSTSSRAEALRLQLEAFADRLDRDRRAVAQILISLRAQHAQDRSGRRLSTSGSMGLATHLLAATTRLGHQVSRLRVELYDVAEDVSRQRRGPVGELARALGPDTGGGIGLGLVFLVCPVDQPRSYSDDFGVLRTGGGYHPHMGNDILAPLGTPVRAPFPGSAVVASNGPGGLAVKVFGQRGFVYNAHLSRFGTLGAVEVGTVIGYVGNTGNAAGGPTHDHFEWHPGGGGAVDPYPYLNQVC